MKLYLVRHARTEAAANGLCCGRTDVAALDADTAATAVRVAALLPAHVPMSTSPRRRCVALAVAIASKRLAPKEGPATSGRGSTTAGDHQHDPGHGHGRDVDIRAVLQAPVRASTVDARLAEMDFGRWEGMPWADIPRVEFDAWLHDFADARPGVDGESVRGFMARVGGAYEAWRASGRDAIWVTHAGVMRAVLLWNQGVRCPTRADQWPSRAIDFGACIEIEPA